VVRRVSVGAFSGSHSGYWRPAAESAPFAGLRVVFAHRVDFGIFLSETLLLEFDSLFRQLWYVLDQNLQTENFAHRTAAHQFHIPGNFLVLLIPHGLI
jgi:hypothetical protein